MVHQAEKLYYLSWNLLERCLGMSGVTQTQKLSLFSVSITLLNNNNSIYSVNNNNNIIYSDLH